MNQTPSPEVKPLDRALSSTGTAGLFLFALAAPWSIAGAQAGVVLAAIGALYRVFRSRSTIPGLPATYFWILGFLAIQAISIPFGIHPVTSLEAFQGSWTYLFPFVFWVLLSDTKIRRRATHLFLVSGALAGLYGVIQHWTGMEWFDGYRLEDHGGGSYMAVGTLGHHLTYSGVMILVFFAAIGRALEAPRGKIARTLPVLLVVLVGLGLFFSYSRAAWIGIAAGLGLLSLHRGKKPFFYTAGLLVAFVAVAVWTDPAIQQRLVSILDFADLPRMRLWETAIRIGLEFPLLGGGVGCWSTLFELYKVPGDYMSVAHPHSDILNVLVETGFVGVLVWIGLWVAFFRDTTLPRPIRVWRVDAPKAGIAAILVAGLAQCYSTDEEVAQVWMFLMAIVLHEARARRRPA